MKQEHYVSGAGPAPVFMWKYLFSWVRQKGLIPTPGPGIEINLSYRIQQYVLFEY
jgi:hypothetical protein